MILNFSGLMIFPVKNITSYDITSIPLIEQKKKIHIPRSENFFIHSAKFRSQFSNNIT